MKIWAPIMESSREILGSVGWIHFINIDSSSSFLNHMCNLDTVTITASAINSFIKGKLLWYLKQKE